MSGESLEPAGAHFPGDSTRPVLRQNTKITHESEAERIMFQARQSNYFREVATTVGPGERLCRVERGWGGAAVYGLAADVLLSR